MKGILFVGAACVLLAGLLISCTTKNVEEQKAQAEASRKLGEAYLGEGQFRSALKEFLKAETLYPDDYLLQDDIGLAYYYLEDQDQAIRHFKQALALKDDYAWARNHLGNAYAKKEEWDKAIKEYKIVISDLLYATPQFPLSNIGYAYYQKKEYGLSQRYYLKALKVEPDFVKALYGLGQTYLAMGKVPEGIEKLEKTTTLSPESEFLYFELAKAYARNRDYTKALSAYHKVVELNPGSTLADRALIEARKIANRQ
jgi:type IV pilus assembly protein PilF